MSVDPTTRIPDWRHRVAVVSGVLLAPFAAMLHLELGYADVAHACRQASDARLQLATLGLFLVALAGAGIAGSVHRRASGGEHCARDRFLGAVGLVLGLLFALVIVAQWLAVVQLDPCQ